MNVADDDAAPGATRRKSEIERPIRGAPNYSGNHGSLSRGRSPRTSAAVADLFDMKMRAFRRDRAARSGSDMFLHHRAFEDCLERIEAMQRRFDRALLIGCADEYWPKRLKAVAEQVEVREPGPLFAERVHGETIIEDAWGPEAGAFDLVVAIGTLDTVNDLPVALRLIRHAMTDGALLIGAMSGGDTLPQLRGAMRAADAVIAAASPHVHPRIEASALAPLLSSAGFVNPVVDVDRVAVTYPSLSRLVADLRSMGATNILNARLRFVGRDAREAAIKAFADAGDGARTTETFEILHFAGWAGVNS